MVDDNAKEMALQVYKHEMKAGETISELYEEHEQSEAREAMLEAFKQILDSVESKEKAESAASVVEMFARQLDDEKMMEGIVKVAKDSGLLEVETPG